MGKIISTLESTGQLNNTVIIFMSDNGGIVHPDENGEPKISNNAPLKGEKALLYEGGVRVPLFIWQPKKWKHSTCNIAVDCTDIFPTVLDLAKKDLSSYKTFGDGQSLLPLLSDPQNSKRTYHKDTIHWHYPFYVGVGLKKDEVTSPRSAIRKDDWKLILNWEGQLELYNIKDDMFETRELSKHQPEKTRELLKSLVQWINRTVEERYIPMQNPKYNESLSNARSFRNIFEEHGLSWPKGRSSRVTDLN
jgi:arylsulfatase A-like enzyme